MTTIEEIEELRELIEKYKALLKEMSTGPFKSATVASPMSMNLFRVKLDSGEETIVTIHPELTTPLKKGDRVLCSNSFIYKMLTPELEIQQEEVKFDFIDWKEIAGLKSQIDNIRESLNAPMMYSKYYKEYGMTPCKGVLLYGPPGCGKTMVAKAIASEFLRGNKINKDSFIYLKGGEMLSPYVGMAENNIKSMFIRARENYLKNRLKSVIFIDEAEAILNRRGSRRSSDVDTTIVPTFLSEMDGFESNSTFIILATNYPNQLDEAVIRPGRIDLKIEIGRPNKEDAKDIFKLYLGKTKCSNCDSLALLASESLESLGVPMSGALIKNIVERASLYAIRRAVSGNNNGVTKEDILYVLKEL